LSQPVVTVIMAMRNAERYVANSARSVLAQSGVDLELVVVDDGSVDRSRVVVEQIAKEDARLRIVDGPRAGIAMAVNAGLAAAKGEFVSRCDSDDLYPPDRLRRQVAWLRGNPDFGAVCGSFETIDARGRLVMSMRTGAEPAEITEELRAGQTRTHFSTFLTRVDVLRRLGGPRAYFEHAEDVDLQLRIGEACRVGYEPGVALRYRIHGASITHSQPDERRRFLDDMTREFQALRRRGLPDPLQAGTEPPAPPPRSSASSPVSASVHVQRLLQGRAWQEHGDGRRGRAVLTGLRALVLRPWSAGGWRTVAALALRPARGGSLAEREKLVKDSGNQASGDGGH
jgi:GT2 family glycosyltransferase